MRRNYLPVNLEKEENNKTWNDLVAGLGRENPCFFAEYLLGLHLNPFQERALLGIINNKQWMWVTSNQIGKTVSLAIAHIYFNFYKIGITGGPVAVERTRYQTLNLSPISRQAQECARYVKEILSSSFTWEEEQIGGKTKRFVNKCKIEWFFVGEDGQQGRYDFDNNSSMFCLSTASDSGSGIQGMQFAFITYDECNQSMHLEEELPARIFSRTAKYAGPVGLVATPDEMGKSQQYWYHLYTKAENDLKRGVKPEWYLIKGVYDENIFITKDKREEFKARLKKLSPHKYQQVVLGKFLSSADRMFTPDMIEGLWNGRQESKPFPVFDAASKPKEYLICCDWGVADQGDETVIFVVDISDPDNVEIINHYAKQGGDPTELIAMANYLWMQYTESGKVFMTLDTADMGGVMFKKMLSGRKPISYGKENKPDALVAMQMRLRNNIRKDLTNDQKYAMGKIKCYYIPKLEAQLSNYKLDDQKIKQDWVMAFSQICWFLNKYRSSQHNTYIKLSNYSSSKN